MKIAIIYSSSHHGNTKKVIDAIAAKHEEIELFEASEIHKKNFAGYKAIGFASGIYYKKFNPEVLRVAKDCTPKGKKVFFIATFGSRASYRSIEKALEGKDVNVIGKFGCKGYDTYGPLQMLGGFCKGRPNAKDLQNAVEFYEGLNLGD